MEEQSYPDGL